MWRNMDWSEHVAKVADILFEEGQYKFKGMDFRRQLWRGLKPALKKKYPDTKFATVTADMFKAHTDEDEEKTPMEFLAGRGKGKKAAGLAILSATFHSHLMQPYKDLRKAEVMGQVENLRPLQQELEKLQGPAKTFPRIGSLEWALLSEEDRDESIRLYREEKLRGLGGIALLPNAAE